MTAPACLERITRAVEYLATCLRIPPTARAAQRCPSSHRLKHTAEPTIGYTTNGEFLVAALLSHIPLRPVEGSPNPILLVDPRPKLVDVDGARTWKRGL